MVYLPGSTLEIDVYRYIMTMICLSLLARQMLYLFLWFSADVPLFLVSVGQSRLYYLFLLVKADFNYWLVGQGEGMRVPI
jgi:hypothetical protein